MADGNHVRTSPTRERRTAKIISTTNPLRDASPDRYRAELASGDKVHWRGYTGTSLRDTVEDQAEVLIGSRTYIVRGGELQSA